MSAVENQSEHYLLGTSGMVDCSALIAAARSLPAMPQSAVRLAAMIASHHYDVRDVAEVAAFDPMLTLRLIRAANSAFRAGAVPVSTVKDAVLKLGSKETLALAVAGHARPFLQRALAEYQLEEGQLWRHSVAAAGAVECMTAHCCVAIPPEAFTAALLHDTGKVVMARFLDIKILDMIRRAQVEGGLGPLQAESQVLDLHHGEIGGILAQHWKMPEAIVKGIIYHHTPEEGIDLVCYVVFAANLLAKATEASLAGKPIEVKFSDAVLSELGLSSEGVKNLQSDCLSRFVELSAQFASR